MELRQLEYLDAVVRHGGFVRAAQEVYVTQSALSQQITRLESELGLALLRRGPKGVEPTPAGVEFLAHARAILDEVARARASVTEHLDGTRGVVRVAATVYDSPGLPEALVAFHRHHPLVQLALHHGAAAQVLEQVALGTADIAVLAVREGAAKLPAQLAVHTLAEQRLWLVSSVDDPLVRSERARGGSVPGGGVGVGPGVEDGAGPEVGVGELRGRPVIMPERGTALRELLVRAFADAGFSPLPLFETSDPETIRQLVAAGLGLSVVPAGWLVGDGPPVATLPIALPAYRIAMLAATEPRVPARDLLVEHLARVMTEDRGP
jgi:DNA-binding transcriptional LysR family regulator